ncbi:MAG: 30S ribosomal protein S5, partial [Planctomycetota bacterium]
MRPRPPDAQGRGRGPRPPAGPGPPRPPGGGARGGGGGGGRGGRPGRGDRRGRGGRGRRGEAEDENRFEERLIQINRCATTVKGGRRMSFSALLVLGDRQGKVGIGFGKAKEVPSALEKAQKEAKKGMVQINLKGSTIPHE